LIEQVNTLFEACLDQLRVSHRLHQQQKSLRGKAKETIRSQREKLIEEIQASIHQIDQILEQCVTLANANEGSLSDLRQELETTMKVAQRTEERMIEMGLREKN
jgi:hypothetical protein